ncbi:MAG: hypothetical protein JXR03_12875 [Cyclobacteriaceae bacterium]
MKKMLVGVVMVLSLFSAKAQDEVSYTDEDLTKYATVMVWAEAERGALKATVKDSVGIWLDEGDVLARSKYNELSKAKKANKLEEVEASEEELSVFTDIQSRIDTKKSSFKENYTLKIKEDIGAGLYNKLKRSLKSDAEVKERYDAIYNALIEGAIGGDEEETSESE